MPEEEEQEGEEGPGQAQQGPGQAHIHSQHKIILILFSSTVKPDTQLNSPFFPFYQPQNPLKAKDPTTIVFAKQANNPSYLENI